MDGARGKLAQDPLCGLRAEGKEFEDVRSEDDDSESESERDRRKSNKASKTHKRE